MTSQGVPSAAGNHRSARLRNAANLLAAAVIIAFSFAAGAPILTHAIQQDFLNLYTGASLVRDGQFSLLHDPSLQLARERELSGPGRPLVPFVRPHLYALLLSPLAMLSLKTAFTLWIGLQLAMFGLLLWLVWREMGSEAVLVLAMFSSLLPGLLHGQDNMFLAVIAYMGYRSLIRDREMESGFWFGMLWIKFHLALGPVLALAAGRKWRALSAFAGVWMLALAANFALSGWEGTALYWRLLTQPSVEGLYPGREKLASLQGLAANLPVPPAWTYAAIGAPVLALTLLALRRRSWKDAWPLAQGGGLYLTPHVYIYDWSVLAPALLATAMDRGKPWVRGLALFLLSPLGAAAFLLSPLLNAGVHAAYIAWLALLALARDGGASAKRSIEN